MDEGLPSISVIVPVYNAAHVLPVTVPALLDQDYPRHLLQLLFVDDGSTDATFRLLQRLTATHPNGRVLTHAQNRGRAAARNTGIAAARGQILLFLDADMCPAPDFVRQHACVHRTPGIVGAVSNPILEGLDPKDPYHQYLRWRRGAAGIGPGKPIPFRYFIIGYTSVQAEAVRAVGGFDERLSYGEDLDLAYRLWQRYPAGFRLAERARVYHLDHGDLDVRVAKLRAFGRDNLPWLLEKHPELARTGGVGFVPSTHAPRTLRTLLGRLLLRPSLAAPLRLLLPYLPRPVANRCVRVVLATAVAEGFREAEARP